MVVVVDDDDGKVNAYDVLTPLPARYINVAIIILMAAAVEMMRKRVCFSWYGVVVCLFWSWFGVGGWRLGMWTEDKRYSAFINFNRPNASKCQWFSGKIQRCHRWAPSSILGWRTIRHDVGGYHTCLSRRIPGFESQWRNSFVLFVFLFSFTIQVGTWYGTTSINSCVALCLEQ